MTANGIGPDRPRKGALLFVIKQHGIGQDAGPEMGTKWPQLRKINYFSP